MNKIKDILLKTNIEADEQEIRDFLKQYEASISSFFKEKWNMHKQEQQFKNQVKDLQVPLQNAKKDKEYSFCFHIDNIGIANVKDVGFEKLPKGLTYLVEEGRIYGIPEVAGDHKIYLYCIHEQGFEAEKELAKPSQSAGGGFG